MFPTFPNREGGGGGSTSATTTPGGPDDRISELPKEILHHILGFLEMDEFLIGTSLVSTKWRNLWKSVSTLNFPTCRRRTDDDDDDSVVVDNGVGGDGGIRNNVEKYHNFVDHVLCLRDSQASRIRIFRYESDDSNSIVSYDDYLERLHNFIVSAVVNQGAQEILIMGSNLDQSSDNNRIIHFNPSIFTSGELRKFTFKLLPGDFLLKFPRSMCSATQLTHLSLAGIILPEGDDDTAQLHLVCPVLKKLVICNCYSEHLKVLDISAPRLNDLIIGNCYSDFLDGCRIEIRTPNLTSFAYSGYVYVDCFTDNLPRLAFASLDFITETGMVEKTTSFATKLLKGLTSAENLVLEGFEVFSQDTLKKLLTPFTCLRILKLTTSCKISSIHGIVHILNNCNSVEGLVVEIRTVGDDDEHLMLPQCRLSHLKRVRIKRLHGHKYEIELVKFLLKNSVVLEGIIIETARDSPKRSIEENLKQFIEDEPSVRRSIKLRIL